MIPLRESPLSLGHCIRRSSSIMIQLGIFAPLVVNLGSGTFTLTCFSACEHERDSISRVSSGLRE